MSTQTLNNGEMTKESRASLRKSNKPIMEKRRRARINSCLTQLKSLVLEGMRKDSSQYSKLEKADILEMTVRHLRNVQRQQMSTAIATDPNVVTKYRAGFNECAGEVFRYLNNVQCVNEDARTKIVSHLSHCLQNVNTQSKPTPVQHQQPITSLPSRVHHPAANVQQTTTLIQPLTVQIPHQTNNSAQQFSSSSVSSIGSSSSSSSSSSFVQQPQATCLLMPGNVSQSCQPSTSPTLVNISTPVTVNNQNISGSFQIVPGNMYNGPVAVYVGQVNNENQRSPSSGTAVPVYTMQVQQQQQQQQQQTDNVRRIKDKLQTKQFIESQNSYCKSELNVADLHSQEQPWRPW